MSEPDHDALFRFQVLSGVRARMINGLSQRDAVLDAASLRYPSFDGSARRVSVRTIYRWLRAFDEGGFGALDLDRSRDAIVPPNSPFTTFLAEQKQLDPRASIPELIRRAKALGIIPADQHLDRTTIYRQARRLGIPVDRRKAQKTQDTRRFAYPHRMDLVLCDGKHFRAGSLRARRVVLIFLDDCTRRGLHAVVGTSESAELFQRGLYETIRKHGLMSIVYLDHGSGFIAEDTVLVVRNIGALLIHGSVAYPQGHGKIERLNQTALNDLLRGLDGRPDVDPAPAALELRIRYYLDEVYNLTPHESLARETPLGRFERDPKPLRFPTSDDDLRQQFIVHLKRLVSPDHIVSVDGVAHEMPKGYAGATVVIHRRLLDGTLHCLHDGRLIEIHPVDLAHNARSRRAQGETTPDETTHPLPKSAADLVFDRDFRPVVDADGGFTSPLPEDPS